MKFNNGVRELETSASLSKKEITLSANAKAFRIILGQIYPDIIKAVVRELFTNAWDSQKNAGNLAKEIEIHTPSRYEPYFAIRDYGTGMTRELIDDIYSRIFESTKDSSNDEAGTFGMGSKTPLGYQDSFVLVSYVDGQSFYYDIYIGQNGVPVIDLKDISETTEENGVYIQMAVRSEDIGNFQNNILHFVFGANTPVKIDGKKFEDAYKTVFETEHYELVKSETITTPHIRMGPVLYRLNYNLLAEYNTSFAHLHSAGLILKFNIGDFDVTGSREDIIYNKESREKINKVLKIISDDMLDKIRDDIESKPNLFEARESLINDHSTTLSKIMNGSSYGNMAPILYKGKTVNETYYEFKEEGGLFTKAFYSANYESRKNFHLEHNSISMSSLVGNSYSNSVYAYNNRVSKGYKPIVFYAAKTDTIRPTTLKRKLEHYFDYRSRNSRCRAIVYQGDLDSPKFKELLEDFGGLLCISLSSIELPKQEREPREPPELACYAWTPNHGGNMGYKGKFDPATFNDKYYVPLYKAKYFDKDFGDHAHVSAICEYFMEQDKDKKKIAMINKSDMKIAEENNLVNIFDEFRKIKDSIRLTDEEIDFYVYLNGNLKAPNIFNSNEILQKHIHPCKKAGSKYRWNLVGIMDSLHPDNKKTIEDVRKKKQAKVNQLLDKYPLLEYCHVNWDRQGTFDKLIQKILKEVA